MTDLWYYAEGEKTRGPCSIDELIPLLIRISDPRRIMIWRHGFDDWKPVEEVREVAQKVFRPPPLKPGPPPIPPASAQRRNFAASHNCLCRIPTVLECIPIALRCLPVTCHRAFGTYRLPSPATGTASRSVFALRNVWPGAYPSACG